MKKLLVFAILLMAPLFGFCDYIDYWTVSLNGKLIYDSRKDNESYKRVYRIDLEQLNLSSSDTLKFSYITDTPCPSCEYNMLLTDQEKNKILLLKKVGYAEFKLTKTDLKGQNDLVEVIYFRTDQMRLIKILELKRKAHSPTKIKR